MEDLRLEVEEAFNAGFERDHRLVIWVGHRN
jgi:hypothetical protein